MEVPSMKTLLLAILSLCFCLSVVVALSQDIPNQAARKTQAAEGIRLRTIRGPVQEEVKMPTASETKTDDMK
jgi:hypothetical protein